VTIGEIVDLLEEFNERSGNLGMGERYLKEPSLGSCFLCMYLSYLHKEKFKYAFMTNIDDRGTLTEFVHIFDCRQVSVNVFKKGTTKGNHTDTTPSGSGSSSSQGVSPSKRKTSIRETMWNSKYPMTISNPSI
jgi:hypothetical protein